MANSEKPEIVRAFEAVSRPKLETIEGLRDTDIRELVERYTNLLIMEKQIAAEKQEIAASLREYLDTFKVPTVLVGETPVTRTMDGFSHRFDEKLMARDGVSKEQIARWKKQVPRRGSVRVTPPGAEKEEAGE